MDKSQPPLEHDSLGIEPFAVTNLHETIQARLMQFISDRGLRAGDRLPSQATQAQALGVSQVAFREAMRALEALGIIQGAKPALRRGPRVVLDALPPALRPS